VIDFRMEVANAARVSRAVEEWWCRGQSAWSCDSLRIGSNRGSRRSTIDYLNAHFSFPSTHMALRSSGLQAGGFLLKNKFNESVNRIVI
jgi:hypothetical protein